MYYRARYYAQGLGRFISADTIVPDGQNPQAWNRYAYTVNNPLKYKDPSGHYMTPWDEGGGEGDPLSQALSLQRGGPLEQAASGLRAVQKYNGPATVDAYATASLSMQPYVQDAEVWSPQTARNYLEALQEQAEIPGKSQPHALSKHSWETPDNLLQEAAIKAPGTSQTRFIDADEMAAAVKTTIDLHLDKINKQVANKTSGTIAFEGPTVNYTGFRQEGGELYRIYGQGPAKVVIQFDGVGSWRLFTAYPLSPFSK